MLVMAEVNVKTLPSPLKNVTQSQASVLKHLRQYVNANWATVVPLVNSSSVQEK